MRRTLGALAAGVVAGVVVAPSSVSAVVNYFDATRIVSGTGTATCPSGWKATGGGTAALPTNYYGSYSSDEYELTSSYPYSTSSWKATGRKVHGTYSSSSGWRFSTFSYSPKVYVICAS